MVFCCIAIVGLAVMYFVLLWLRQLFLWFRLDKEYPGEPPPRALTGNGALPVYGHTRLFARLAGDVALLFPSDWLQVGFLPERFQRRLGECFAIFIWGQWRVSVKGAERATQVLNTEDLREGWPWTPPISLLGKSCTCFLEDDEVNQLRNIMKTPLSHDSVLRYAPVFAQHAENCLEDIRNEVFCKHSHHAHDLISEVSTSEHDGKYEEDSSNGGRETGYKIKWEALRSYTFDIVDGPLLAMFNWNTTRDYSGENNELVSSSKNEEWPSREKMIHYMEQMKLGLDVIKLTFGPDWMYIWMLNEYGRALHARRKIEKVLHEHVTHMSQKIPVKRERGHAFCEPSTKPIPLLTLRKNMLRSNEDIFGGQNTRRNSSSEDFYSNRRRTRSAPDIFHDIGDVSDHNDPFPVSDFDLSPNESDFTPSGTRNRRRTVSAPDLIQEVAKGDYVSRCSSVPLDIEQDLVSPTSENQNTQTLNFLEELVGETERPIRGHSTSSTCSTNTTSPKGVKWMDQWVNSDTGVLANTPKGGASLSTSNDDPSNKGFISPPTTARSSVSSQESLTPLPEMADTSSTTKQSEDGGSNYSASASTTAAAAAGEQVEKSTVSLLELMLRQESEDGQGVSQVVMTEISIMLWMMLDAGNVWTVMALNLLSADARACELVQNEIHNLETEFGHDQLFTPSVLDKMEYLDALIFEAIRLCPPFLGGLKKTSETVFFSDDGIQIPKGSNVFFCQPTEKDFNIRQALGKRPDTLGETYPSIDLFGFLPFRGLGVPLMVLQNKVFLAALLRGFTPCTTKRKTFIRRVTTAVAEKWTHSPIRSRLSIPVGSATSEGTESNHSNKEAGPVRRPCSPPASPVTKKKVFDPEQGHGALHRSESTVVTPREAMSFFTKLPFPEPLHDLYLIPQSDGEEDSC